VVVEAAMKGHKVVGLRRSGLLQLSVELLSRHHDDGTGTCAGCGVPLALCVPRRNSGKVIAAAGLDPTKFDSATLLDGCAYVRAELTGRGW